MKKTRSPKQIEASRRNAQKSTGPKTPEGRAKSKMNALKHGILSTEVVVHGRCISESSHEFKGLHKRLCEDLKPAGLLEEILVDQIVTTHWRLRRVLKAESGEIALSVDGGQWKRDHKPLSLTILKWAMAEDPVGAMRESASGNCFLKIALKAVRTSVEKEGELTEAAVQSVIFQGKPYGLTEDLKKLRSQLQQNPDGLDASALKEQALRAIDLKLEMLEQCEADCEEREEKEEEARQAAAVLPSPEVLDKIMRYETMLQRQLHRDMIQLERLQRRRLGEAVPPPLTLEVT